MLHKTDWNLLGHVIAIHGSSLGKLKIKWFPPDMIILIAKQIIIEKTKDP